MLGIAVVLLRETARADRPVEVVQLLLTLTCHMQIFFDINSDGQPLGRIAVELFDDVPIGSLRFQELAEGYEGISYQLSKFSEIGPVSHCRLGAHLRRLPSLLGRSP